MNSFGKNLRLTTFGESHGEAIGAIIDGCPAGLKLDISDIQNELDKRKPGSNKISSQRKEDDKAQILSGVFEGKTLGTPITVIVKNKDHKSKDYENIKNLFRPGHSDQAWQEKFGIRDYRGGGRSSGRETIGRVIGGAIAKKILKQFKIGIFAHTISIGELKSNEFVKKQIEKNPVKCADKNAAKLMEDLIINTKQNGDSIGGIINLHIINLSPGIGEPVFNKLQALIAHAIFSIGAVRSLELLPGKILSTMHGSQSNKLSSGISGGISSGDEIVFQIGIKPTPSIAIPQNMKDKKGKIHENIVITGRHDPCLVPRIVPVVESMGALVIADLALEQRLNNIK